MKVATKPGMKTRAKAGGVLALCGALGCSGQTSAGNGAVAGNDAAPDATRGDAARDAESGVAPAFRGFVGVAQTYADQKNGPKVYASQVFLREDPCDGVSGAPAAFGPCAVTATSNECGGLTFSGYGDLSRVQAADVVAFRLPFDGGRMPLTYSPQTYFSPGEVGIQGRANILILPPNQFTLSEAIVAFDPLETLRVSIVGDVVPPFTTEVQMPSRAVFSTPDLASSELVVTNAPIEVAWTADGSVGTVEVWSAYAVTPDARSDMTLVHCSAPLGAGRLTVPPLPTQGQSGTGIVTSAIAVRVQNTQLLQADGWAVQVTAASFDSGPVTTVARAADAAPSSHFDAAIPALR